MNPIFQYIAATVIVVLSLGFTLYAVASASMTSLGGYSQLQLMPVADSLMQTLLLSPGSPSDWGTDLNISASQLQSFGLAQATPFGKAYSIDPNKLNRIISTSFITNQYYIPPAVVGKLLGIYQNNHFLYGFDLRLMPALNISLSQLNSNSTMVQYLVTVKDYTGGPAINANVTVSQMNFCAVIKGQGSNNNVPNSFGASSTSASNLTNLTGNTTIWVKNPVRVCNTSNGGNGNPSIEEANVTVVNANYFGLQYQSLFDVNACKTQMMIEGKLLIANFTAKQNGSCNSLTFAINNSKNNNNGAAFPIFTAFEVTSNLNIQLDQVVNSSTGGRCSLLNKGSNDYCVYELKNPISPSTVFAGLIIVINPGNANGNSGKIKTYFIVASNPSTPSCIIEYTSDNLTTSAQSENTCGYTPQLTLAQIQSAVTVSRFVTIGYNTWYATLTVWRMGS